MCCLRLVLLLRWPGGCGSPDEGVWPSLATHRWFGPLLLRAAPLASPVAPAVCVSMRVVVVSPEAWFYACLVVAFVGVLAAATFCARPDKKNDR